MPPKSKTQRKAPTANQELCCICLQRFGLKDEILSCSGNCQKYLHRYCASVSEQATQRRRCGAVSLLLLLEIQEGEAGGNAVEHSRVPKG